MYEDQNAMEFGHCEFDQFSALAGAFPVYRRFEGDSRHFPIRFDGKHDPVRGLELATLPGS
jgi:hypothetical protein